MLHDIGIIYYFKFCIFSRWVEVHLNPLQFTENCNRLKSSESACNEYEFYFISEID